MHAWDLHSLCEDLRDVLAAEEEALRLEQAVRGLDVRDERALQALLAAGLTGRYEVAREVHYPSARAPKLSHRARCDLVLTERDPPRDALWLEVKVACQLREGGARHAGYGSQWRRAVVADLRKMAADPLIRHAALSVIVFNESEEVLQKDLELFEAVLVREEVLAGFRRVGSFPIVDRIGHRLCSIAVWPTLQR